jgi:uncharacterized damage-inducible protein DinB
MFRTINDFTEAWSYEAEITTQLFGLLTDQSLGQKITADGRSLGFLAWHIVITLGELPGKTGLVIDCPHEDEPAPDNVAAICEAFEKAAKSVSEQVAANWTDEKLLEEDEMYGMIWKKGQSLSALVNHQAHHRGQMTVLMRQAGLPVVGIYGPAKEEWEAMGMTPLP